MTRPPDLRRGARRALLTALLAVGLAAAGVVLARGPEPAAADPPATSPDANPSCPSPNPPNTLALVGGTPQTAKLGSAFDANLQVTLANTNGCPLTTPIAGIAVTFSAPASGASGTFSASGSNSLTVGTDQTGMASAAIFSANDVAGSYSIGASSSYGSVTFAMSNTAAGIPATLATLAPARQSARVATRYRRPLAVRVLDANGNPAQGTSVIFALGAAAGGSGAGGSDTASAGATFSGGTAQATETTDSSGVARSPSFTANSVAGTFTATATIATSAGNGANPATSGNVEPASFSLDNRAGTPPAIRAVGGTHRSARVGIRYPRPLKVKVLDSNGKPEQGASVTFTLGASSGGSSAPGTASAGAIFAGGATQATATTAASGIATSPRFSANTTAGRFTVTATLADSTRAASFVLQNLAGTPRTVTAGAAASESTPIRARFSIRLAVTVTDADTNPVAGVLVTFSAPARGPSGTFAGSRVRMITVRTNASGIAVAPVFTANPEQGGYVVKATVRHAQSAAFALVNETAGQA
jgi:hypothetical protein